MSVGYYERNAEAFFRGTVDADMTAARNAFAGRVKPGGHILDAGCGSGRDTRALHAMGFDVTAMEASPRLAELACAYTGLPVELLTFDQVAWREVFDGVWACASLLHVPRADLAAAVRRLRDSLKPGGILWISFKYGTTERRDGDRYFTDLDEAGAEALLAQVDGLDLISSDVTVDVRPGRDGERWLALTCQRT